jgi:cytidylate kinase
MPAPIRTTQPRPRRLLGGSFPPTSGASSAVAAIPGVRAALLEFQRGFGAKGGAVLDGRDIGTVIFPAAPAKLFITASPAERARRRWLELRAKGLDVDLTNVEHEMRARDERDSARAAAPLRPAEDAVVLDTSDMDAEAAFLAAIVAVRDRLGLA